MSIIPKWIVIFALTGLLVGCAAHRPMQLMVTRRNSPDAPISMTGIVLAKHQQSRPEELRLKRALMEVLKVDAISTNSAAEADYVLAYWIDESWDEVVHGARTTGGEHHMVVVGQGGDSTGGRMAGESFRSLKEDSEEASQLYISKKGVKLVLYSNRLSGAARLSPVWEGYIELGSTESPEHLKAAVESLLAQLGKDFTGRVRLPK